jgi:hypothetical protein
MSAGPVDASASVADLEGCFLEYANAARSAAGVSSVVMAVDIVPAVRSHSSTMSDTSLRHTTAAERAVILPSGFTHFTENVAVSPSTLADCGIIHDLFMSSSLHRANILDPAVDFLAVGVHIDSGGTWVTELFFAAEGYTPGGEGTFWDDDGSIFQDDIETLVAAGITSGCAEGRFCPGDAVTRGQMAAFLVRTLDLPEAASAGFTDTAGSTFADDIDRIAAERITTGCGDDRFCPHASVTRGQMAAFLVRALSLPEAASAGFSDTAGSTFADDIDRLAAAGITSGCGGGAFCPDAVVTRGQMAAFLVRALEHLEA